MPLDGRRKPTRLHDWVMMRDTLRTLSHPWFFKTLGRFFKGELILPQCWHFSVMLNPSFGHKIYRKASQPVSALIVLARHGG
jgi:hypothetical protein